MTDPIQLEIKKDGLQQKQDGTWTLKLTVNGEDMQDCPILSAAMGQRYLAVLVELTDDDEEAAHRKAQETARHLVGTQEKPKQHWDDMPLSKQAGIRCKEPQFQDFMVTKIYEQVEPTEADIKKYGTDGAFAACRARQWCGVISFRTFPDAPMASERWKALDAEYRQATGQVAEDRSSGRAEQP